MSKTKVSTRIIALLGAVVFFATSFALSFFVIWDTVKGKDDPKTTTTNQASTSNQNEKPKEGALQGTKLSGFEPVSAVSELQKIDVKEGTGEVVQPGATITAHYTGAVASTGEIFQSSYDFGEPVEFGLNGVIKGWTEGVPGMKVGGTRRLVIPAAMAYGANPPAGSGIPANADLVFDITLVKIGK